MIFTNKFTAISASYPLLCVIADTNIASLSTLSEMEQNDPAFVVQGLNRKKYLYFSNPIVNFIVLPLHASRN